MLGQKVDPAWLATSTYESLTAAILLRRWTTSGPLDDKTGEFHAESVFRLVVVP